MSHETSTLSSANRFAEQTYDTAKQSSRDMVEHYPLSTGLAVFATGFTAGILIGYAMLGPTRRPSNRIAEDFGSRILETMSDYVPDMISKRFG